MDRIRGFSYTGERNRAPERPQGFSFQAFNRGEPRNTVGSQPENFLPENTTWLYSPRRHTIKKDGPVLSQHFHSAREFSPEQLPDRFIGQNNPRISSTMRSQESRVVPTTGGRLTFGPPAQARAKPEHSRMSNTPSTQRQEPYLQGNRPSRCFSHEARIVSSFLITL